MEGFRWRPAVVKTRGEYVETVHCGGAVAVDTSGKVLYELGETGSEETFFRSSVKIWQAQPMMNGPRTLYGFTDAEVALACSSHNGEERHVAMARGMLSKIGTGLPVSALLCGTHEPYSGPLLGGEKACALHNNCSGKHAGMLAACVFNQWPLETYQHHDHPLQVAIRQCILKSAMLPSDTVLRYGIDGCGVPSYVLSLRQMATMYAAVARDFPETRRCVAENSWCIAGRDEFDTLVPEVTKRRIISKRGGAALQCANVDNIGIAIKVACGTSDCKETMAMRVFEKLNLLSDDETQQLSKFSVRPLRNVAGTVIGEQSAIF